MNLIKCRKNVASLNDTELFAFRDAVFRLKEQGRYDKYVNFHGFVSNLGHSGPAFLPWHRVFLLKFEEELQSINPDLSLPYWDFTSSNIVSGSSKIWRNDFFGLDQNVTLNWTGADGNAKSWNIVRDSFNLSDVPVTPASVSNALALASYPDFRPNFENGPHGSAHVFLGVPGDQSSFATAVNDPFFMLLHCNVDRIWARWQWQKRIAWLTANPGQPYPDSELAIDYFWDGSDATHTWPTPANRHNLDDIMWPWDGSESDPGNAASAFAPWTSSPETYTPRMTLNYQNLGYIYDDDPPIVTSETSTITFNDIPEGEETARAAVFDVVSCNAANFQVVSGPTVTNENPAGSGAQFNLPLGGSVMTEIPTSLGETKGRIWVTYQGTDENDTATGTIKIRCVETGEEWDIPITANTIRRPKVAVALLLDKSGSMDNDSGDGRKRIDVLHNAGAVFMEVIQDDHAVGIASFAVGASADMVVKEVGGAFGAGRNEAKSKIQAHAPLNQRTSIGNGLEVARNLLSTSFANTYDTRAIIALTDGHENEPKWISEVGTSIDSHVFAIGLGTADQIKPAALTALTNSTGGYMEMTGNLNVDDAFRLEKYYLQILASVTNTDIVVDPDDFILAGSTKRIPFDLNETDISTDIILLAQFPSLIEFALETPQGDVIHVGNVNTLPGVIYRNGNSVQLYRVTLPVPIGANVANSGKWYALLKGPDRKKLKYSIEDIRQTHGSETIQEILTHGIKYSFNVHAYTNLRMRSTISQTGFEPGDVITVTANLTEYGLPVTSQRARIKAILTLPDQRVQTVNMQEVTDGVYELKTPTVLSGVYRYRLIAEGRTLRYRPFRREQLLSTAVHNGGNTPPPNNGTHGSPEDGRDEKLCRLIACLMEKGVLDKFFDKNGIDPDAFYECLKNLCDKEPTRFPAISLLDNSQILEMLKLRLK